MKICAKCLVNKNSEEFNKMNKCKDGLHVWCRACCADYQKTPAGRASQCKYNLKRRFNLTEKRYVELLEKQQNRCAICKTEAASLPKKLSVDHDHECCPGDRSCGHCIRELLCFHCNAMLGMSRDSVSFLLSGIEYLKRHGK